MEKIIYENELGRKVELSKFRPFILENIDGVGGLETLLVTSKVPGQDGYNLHNSLLEARDITIEAGIKALNKADRYAKREELIKVFTPKLKGKLTYINDYLERTIDCYVDKAPVWGHSVNSMQKFMVQLYCPNPFFTDVQSTKSNLAYWRGDFEFPLEILEGGIELGYRESSLIVNIFNKGDVKCGMEIEFKALATVKSPSLFDVHTRKFIRIKKDLEAGDLLIVNTNFGNKRVELLRANGVRENVFHYIDLKSDFLQLDVGDNLLRYDAEEGIDNLEVGIYHTPAYMGV